MRDGLLDLLLDLLNDILGALESTEDVRLDLDLVKLLGREGTLLEDACQSTSQLVQFLHMRHVQHY